MERPYIKLSQHSVAVDVIDETLAELWDTMTETQKETIISILKEYEVDFE